MGGTSQTPRTSQDHHQSHRRGIDLDQKLLAEVGTPSALEKSTSRPCGSIMQFHSPRFSGQGSSGPSLSELSGGSVGCELWDESPVPAGQSKEGPHLLLCTWAWAATDGFDLVHQWLDLASSKPITQVLHLLFHPLTLGRIQFQACLLDLS